MLDVLNQITALPGAVRHGLPSIGGSLQEPLANIVPSERQSLYGVVGSENATKLSKDYVRDLPAKILRHPRQAPSGVTSEQFLSAKSLLAPAFQHSIMATKISQISNLYSEAPRFRDQVDILA